MCEFHESTCNGFGDIWWTDNPIYFSSIDWQGPRPIQSGQCANAIMGGGLEWVVESTTVRPYTVPARTGGIFHFPWHRHQMEGTDGF